ncbi:MAG: gliding motility lipoprotein GldB, partial [Marinirhabdus sp.]
MKHFFIALLAVTAVSCDPKSDVAGAIEKIPIDVTIVRFDKEFAAATRATLPQLKAKRPLFFPQQYADSVWVTKINDTLQQQLNHEVATAFPDNQQIEDQLLPLFKHIKYYFPQFTTPTVYTTTSDVDHRNKAIVADSLL